MPYILLNLKVPLEIKNAPLRISKVPFSYFQHPIPSFELEGNSELSRWYISHKMYLIENSEKLLNKLAYCNNYY